VEIIVLPKHRGRQAAAYGPLRCFFCYRKAHLSLDSFLYHCQCGWSGTFPMAERADGVRYVPNQPTT
jgi:hypothetical protein